MKIFYMKTNSFLTVERFHPEKPSWPRGWEHKQSRQRCMQIRKGISIASCTIFRVSSTHRLKCSSRLLLTSIWSLGSLVMRSELKVSTKSTKSPPRSKSARGSTLMKSSGIKRALSTPNKSFMDIKDQERMEQNHGEENMRKEMWVPMVSVQTTWEQI